MSNYHYRSKLITPRSIQVTAPQAERAEFYLKHQGLGDIIKEGAERVRDSQMLFNSKLGHGAMTDNYDMSSIYWALGISVALFLVVTILRNK